jgi:hypothetical protein
VFFHWASGQSDGRTTSGTRPPYCRTKTETLPGLEGTEAPEVPGHTGRGTGTACRHPLTTSLRSLRILGVQSTPSSPSFVGACGPGISLAHSCLPYSAPEFPGPCPLGRQGSVGHRASKLASNQKQWGGPMFFVKQLRRGLPVASPGPARPGLRTRGQKKAARRCPVSADRAARRRSFALVDGDLSNRLAPDPFDFERGRRNPVMSSAATARRR